MANVYIHFEPENERSAGVVFTTFIGLMLVTLILSSLLRVMSLQVLLASYHVYDFCEKQNGDEVLEQMVGIGGGQSFDNPIRSLGFDSAQQLPGDVDTVTMELSWGFTLEKLADVDGSLVYWNEDGERVDSVYYGKLVSDDRSAHHSGDDRTGMGEGVDELLTIDLNKIGNSVTSVFMCVHVYEEPHTLENLSEVSCKVIGNGEEIITVDFDKQHLNENTGLLVCNLYRDILSDSGWAIRPIMISGPGRTYWDSEGLMQPLAEEVNKKVQKDEN